MVDAKKAGPAKKAAPEKKPAKKPAKKRSGKGKSSSAPPAWIALLLSTLTGILVFTTYPKYDIFPLQWFALVPLMAAIARRGPGKAFLYGAWAGLVTNAGGFYWIVGMLQDFGHFSFWLALPIAGLLWGYQGLVFGVWAGLYRWLCDRTNAPILLIAPVTWVAVETLVPFIFPWYLGNGQYLFYAAIQVVELTGVLGLSFLLVLVNSGLYLGLVEALAGRWKQAARPVGLVALVFTINVVYGLVRIAQVDAQQADAATLKIGVAEANVGIFEKQARGLRDRNKKLDMLRGNILKHQLLAADLEKQGVDLIIEAESSFIPSPAEMVRYKRNDLFAVVAGSGRDAWELRDTTWSGPQRVERSMASVNGMVAAREDHLFAVGPGGFILRNEGGDWTPEPSKVEVDLHAVWAGEVSPVLRHVDGVLVAAAAVGDNGTALLRNAKDDWRAWDTGTNATLRGVGGNGAQRIVAVGDGGTALLWDGTSWKPEKTPTRQTLRSVWMNDDGEAVAVGDGGVVLTRRAATWTEAPISGAGRLHGVTYGEDTWWAVGDKGAIWRRTGRDWKSVSSPTKETLRAVAVNGRGEVLVVGRKATLLRAELGSASFKTVPAPRGAGDLYAVAGVPFTAAHAFGRDSRYIYQSQAPLPDYGDDVLAAVDGISEVLARDTRPRSHEWNTPLRGFKTPILMGLLTYEPKDPDVPALKGRDFRRTYNSAVLMDGDGRVLGRYDKNYLLVFGEYIPFGDIFPQFYQWLPEASHFTPGEDVDTFAFKGHKLGVIVCYEDILPEFTRKLAGKDPHVIINVTNDAWFGDTSEPYLHLALSIFRSVENRLWLIRSTNTGISAYVDAVGRIVASTRMEDPEMLVVDVPMLRSSTLYRSWGDLFAWTDLIVFAVLAVAALRARKSRQRKLA